jgi:DMSO/TMAO reductase YedYZ molybdopterin-dependent catalytic subunit
MKNQNGTKNPISSKDRVPPGQKKTDKWPILHYGEVQLFDISQWKFSIFGLVENGRKLNFSEFTALPQVKIQSDIHCVTGWSKLDNVWEGVSTGTIKDIVKILPEAKFVMVHSKGGFTTNLSLNDFFQSDVLLALRHNNEELTPGHGYPVRLVVPKLYFWKSAKWVEGIEFIEEDKLGFWESHGYHRRGDPWKEERYSD